MTSSLPRRSWKSETILSLWGMINKTHFNFMKNKLLPTLLHHFFARLCMQGVWTTCNLCVHMSLWERFYFCTSSSNNYAPCGITGERKGHKNIRTRGKLGTIDVVNKVFLTFSLAFAHDKVSNHSVNLNSIIWVHLWVTNLIVCMHIVYSNTVIFLKEFVVSLIAFHEYLFTVHYNYSALPVMFLITHRFHIFLK